MGLFRKSFTHKYNCSISSLVFSQDHQSNFNRPIMFPEGFNKFSPVDDDISQYRNASVFQAGESIQRFMVINKTRTNCEKCAVALQKIASGNSLLPVKLPGTKSDLVVRKLWFVVSWILCILILIVCVTIILFNAWKLPIIKDQKFLTVFFGAVIFDAIIISFLKIFLFSAVLSYMFNNKVARYGMTTYHIRIKEGARQSLFGNINFLANLLETRKQAIYYPLPEWIKEGKILYKLRKYKWRIILEMLVVSLLLIVIFVNCKIYYINRYNSNTHAARMMTTGENILVPDVQNVFNRSELIKFSQLTYLAQLYRFMWYNFEPLVDPESNRRDWASDCVMRQLGNTQIRQLRVSVVDCQVNAYFENLAEFCVPPWSHATEDKITYATGWKIWGYNDTNQKKTTWSYVEAKNSNSSRFYGRSGTLYHRGGYIASLGHSRRLSRGRLSELELAGWLDHMTRAVFVELTLYNANTQLFTQFVLVSEQQPTGQYISWPKVESVTINTGFDFFNICFLIFLVFFVLRIFYFMNRQGFFGYLSIVLNRYDVFLSILGVLTVVLYILHVAYSSFYIKQYHSKGIDTFFSFFEIIRFNLMLQGMLCFLIFCIVIKLFLSWRFNIVYLWFYYTFLYSWSLIFWLSISFIIFLVVIWRFIGYKLNSYIFSYYSITIIYSKDFRISGVHERGLEHLVVYFMCILSSFVILLFIVLFTHLYKVVKRFPPLTEYGIGNFTFSDFLIDELKSVFKTKK